MYDVSSLESEMFLEILQSKIGIWHRDNRPFSGQLKYLKLFMSR